MSRTEIKVSGTDTDEQIAHLKRKKTASKTALTKCRNRLSSLLEEELPDRRVIRYLIDEVSSLQQEAVDVMISLQILYQESGNLELAKKTNQEIDLLEVIAEEAIEKAELLLRNTFSTSGSSHRPCKDKKQVVKNGDEEPKLTHQQQNPSEHSSDIAHDKQAVNKTDLLNQACVGAAGIGQDLWRQLKRVSIPVFSGDIHSYQSWKAAFMACVDRAPATNEYKLLQLKQYLAGEAFKLVDTLGHNAAAYAIALERLERKYGGSRRIIALKLEEISNFRPLRQGNTRDLEQFADMLDTAVVCLREADKVEELGDGCLYAVLQKKLTEQMITQYKRWVIEQQRQESVETLREWILFEAELHTIASETKYGFSDNRKASSLGKSSNSYFGTQTAFVEKCQVCNVSSHRISKCEAFKALAPNERWTKAKELKLCFRCLSTGHVGKSCTQKGRCEIGGCLATHNRLLHFNRPENRTGNKPGLISYTADNLAVAPSMRSQASADSATQTTTMSTVKQQGHCIALRTIPVVLKNGNRRLKVNALLDDASTQTYINESIASELGLSGQARQVSVNVLNSKMESFSSMTVQLGLESIDGSVDTFLTAMTTSKVTGNLKAIDWQKHAKRWPHLKDINFPKVASKPIVDILIGVDYLQLHTSRGDVCGNPGDPIARLTPLGWTCIGNISESKYDGSNTFFVRNNEVESPPSIEMDHVLQKFWEIESFPSDRPAMSANDQLAVDSVKESISYSNERYSVGIPWKKDPCDLPDNYIMAYNRLENVEKKLSKDQSLSEAYGAVIEQYLQKGYIHKVQEGDIQNTQWYLPHFPVVKMDRETTKIRIVFDASAKCKGVSLNDFIHPGPKLQNELFEILIRFRRYPVGVICDVAEMYLQIEVMEKDRSCLRFLWRSMDSKSEPTVYEFSRVVFGLNCSPFLAQFVSQEHARRNEDANPLAAEVVLKSTYMDDSMDSFVTDAMTIKLYEHLKALWETAGMHARKWISNSFAVLNEIPVKNRLKEVQIQSSDLPLTKALGLIWSAEMDQFQFSFSFQNTSFALTKRNFLKTVARLFDPLGFIAPFLIRAKILLQKMWVSGLEWDANIGCDLENKVWQWIKEIDGCKYLKIPRCIHFVPEVGLCKLHVFVDASQEAYGAVIYSVTRQTDTSSSTLVAAKAHVAPLKTVSIPRLELVAAVLGVKLLMSVIKALDVAVTCATLWSDSINVLWWVKNQSRSFKSFVANRVSYIQEHTRPSQWMYVPTQSNPADVLTRGTGIQSLSNDSWLHGPDFILKDEVPKQIVDFKSCKNVETKPFIDAVSMVTNLTTMTPWRLDSTRFSNLPRLCRVTSWVLRFIHNCRVPRNLRQCGSLHVEEIEDAETRIIKNAQIEAFPSEYNALTRGKTVPANSKLLRLSPVLDQNGLMRLGGRLKHAHSLSFEAKYPIILPRKNWVTRLVVKFHHEKVLHTGTNSTLSSLSARFWVISAREVIREWENECAYCKRQKTKPTCQIMADLPAVRVRCSMRAFSQVGIDFAGPFLTIQGRGKARQKRYLCLFTCLATRAVHLGMAFGLDTNAFMNAFFRMTHRRGMPKEVITDNGTNFVGAAKELKHLISKLDSDHVNESLGSKGIVWNFNPPHAPHFGGVFEALIKSAKRAIFAILGGADINDEELMTAFTSTEALLNSRPLTYQSSHPLDQEPLTPNHFIHGQVGGEFAPEFDIPHPQKRWRRVQELVSHTWKRWMKEWLPMLNCRKRSPDRRYSCGSVS